MWAVLNLAALDGKINNRLADLDESNLFLMTQHYFFFFFLKLWFSQVGTLLKILGIFIRLNKI